MEADTVLSEQFYLGLPLQKACFNSHKNSLFYIPISGQSLCQAAVDTFRVNELDFSFVLSSRKQTPEQIESYYVNFITLFVTINLCQPWCFFFLCIHTSYTSKHPLNFKLVTELQHCQNNCIAKHQLIGFLHFLCLFVVGQAPILRTVLVNGQLQKWKMENGNAFHVPRVSP